MNNKKQGMKLMCIFVASFALTSLFCYGVRSVHRIRMQKVAQQGNRAVDNAQNLIVMDGVPAWIGASGSYLWYNINGCIMIRGKAREKGAVSIAEFTLDQGVYEFSGMFGDNDNVALQLYEILDDGYRKLCNNVKAGDVCVFTIQDAKNVQVRIIVYEGDNLHAYANPVLFRNRDAS